jgi:outer membrane protein assembly factor BamE (lipoprotein component of BamABCDE complex)
MNKILLLLTFFLITNCSLKNVDNNHGVAFLEEKIKKLKINKTNKNDIVDYLGPPSTKSLFDNDMWIYIERKTTKSSLIKLGREKNLKNNVLVLEINNRGLLVSKKLYTLGDSQSMKFSEKTTFTSDKDSFVFGFVSSLKQKIDNPRRNKKP